MNKAADRPLTMSLGVLATAIVGLAVLVEMSVRIYLGHLLASQSFGPLKFGRLPLEALAGTWFIALAALEVWTARTQDPERRRRASGYRFLLTVAGTALVIWSAFARQGHSLPPEYIVAGICIVALFAYCSWTATIDVVPLIRHLLPDFADFSRQLPTWISIALASAFIVAAPRTVQTEAIRSGSTFQSWFLSQPRVPFPEPLKSAQVVIVEFIDYQCPFCREAERRYEAVLSTALHDHPSDVIFLRYDFPLERECNSTPQMKDVHRAACEAAVAVRLATRINRQTEMAGWLWDHQSDLTRESVFAQLRSLGAANAEDTYAAVLNDVSAQSAIGQRLGIKQTPTFWLNGVLLNVVSADSLAWAIEHELHASTQRGAPHQP
jgi:protein-disulfide isomerase